MGPSFGFVRAGGELATSRADPLGAHGRGHGREPRPRGPACRGPAAGRERLDPARSPGQLLLRTGLAPRAPRGVGQRTAARPPQPRHQRPNLATTVDAVDALPAHASALSTSPAARRWRRPAASGGCWTITADPVPDSVYALLERVGERVPHAIDAILERDGAFPPIDVLLGELDWARAALAAGRARRAADLSAPPAPVGPAIELLRESGDARHTDCSRRRAASRPASRRCWRRSTSTAPPASAGSRIPMASAGAPPSTTLARDAAQKLDCPASSWPPRQSLHKFLTTCAASRLTLEAMKLFRHIITIVCLVATFIANAGEQLTTKAKCAVNQPTNAELQLLQGTWEGVLVGDKAHQKITITITGNSLHFHRDTNFWFETTITLPAGKDPKQLHATIKGCPPSQAIASAKLSEPSSRLRTGH